MPVEIYGSRKKRFKRFFNLFIQRVNVLQIMPYPYRLALSVSEIAWRGSRVGTGPATFGEAYTWGIEGWSTVMDAKVVVPITTCANSAKLLS